MLTLRTRSMTVFPIGEDSIKESNKKETDWLLTKNSLDTTEQLKANFQEKRSSKDNFW